MSSTHSLIHLRLPFDVCQPPRASQVDLLEQQLLLQAGAEEGSTGAAMLERRQGEARVRSFGLPCGLGRARAASAARIAA